MTTNAEAAWSLPVGWTQWTGLLMPEGESSSNSNSSEEEALQLWLLFERDEQAADAAAATAASAPRLRLETRFTVLQQYALSGALDVSKRTIHLTQTCLPEAQHTVTWHTRDFSAAITLAPHEDEPGKLKWQLEGTFFATAPSKPSSGTGSRASSSTSSTSSGSFFLEASGPIPPSALHTYGFKRRSLGGLAPGVAAALLLPSLPRDVELVWEELPPSSQSASPLRVPLSINGGVISGSSASLVDSSSSLFDGQPFTVSGYIEDAAASVGGGPSFEFVVQCDGGETRIKCTGRVAVEHEGRATADLDSQALRLRGTRTLVDAAHGVFEFQGPFTLRISNAASALPSSVLSHKRKTALSGTATPTGSPSPRPSAAAKQQPVLQIDAEPECTTVITEEAATAIEAQDARVQAEEESRAKADAEAAAAAEAALAAERAAEASRANSEAERNASAKAQVVASAPLSSNAGRTQRPEDALAAQHEESMRLKAVADAKAAALAVDREHEEQQHQETLAAQRKAVLEAESLRRREAMQAEALRLRALADASQAQLERSRASRLASIEATRAAIAAARLEEETSGRNPQATADAERRKAASQAKRAGQRSLPEWDEDAEDVDIGSFDQRVGPTHHAGVAVFHRPTAADLVAAAAAEEARQMSPVRLRAPPPPLFDYLKNHTETGILPHVFDLLAVAAPPPLSVDYALRDVLQASAASAQPLTPGALLPLTLLFGPEGLPEAAYHTDTHGCIRRNEWSTLDPRAIFLKFERNVTLQRAALAAAVATSGGSQAASSAAAAVKAGQPEEELSAVLLVLDGTLPTLALSLLDVGVLLKNGLGAVRSIPATYSNTAQGFLVQTMVFPSMQNSTATSTSGAPTVGASGSKSTLHVPHLSVYRVDFSSAHHLEVEKRTNRYALYAPSALPGHSQGSSGSSAVTPHMRVATFKSPEVERLIHSEMLSGRGSESVANRETFALLRRICVAILKRVNDKCRTEEVVVQRLCLYFAVELSGPVHLLYGDRIDLRLPHNETAATNDHEHQDHSDIGESQVAEERTAVRSLSATYASSPLRRAAPPQVALKSGARTWQ